MCPDPDVSKRSPFRTAMYEAASHLWKGKRSETQSQQQAYVLTDYFTRRWVVFEMDDLQTAWIEDFKKTKILEELSPSTINSYLSVLKQINQYALRRNPPLATKELHIKFLARPKVEQWWLNDDDMKLVGAYCMGKVGAGDYTWESMWLLVQLIVYNGLRVEEAFRLEKRHLLAMWTNSPSINVPGTKTYSSLATIPMFKDTEAAIEDFKDRCGLTIPEGPLLVGLYYENARLMWNEIREYLGVSHLPTSTLRALRRTFAYRANRAGMPTRTLQKVLRHGSIQTTERYLTLVGADEAEQARNYL